MNLPAHLNLGPLSLLLTLGAFHGLFLAVVFLTTPRENPYPNRIFALLLLLFTLTIADAAIEYSNLIYRLPRLYQTSYPLQYLIGPLFLFYFRSLSERRRRFAWFDTLHLVPSILALLLFWPYYAGPDQPKIAGIEAFRSSDFYSVSIFDAFLWLTPLVQRGVYLLITIVRIRTFEGELRDRSSDNDRIIRLRWLDRFARTYSWFLLAYCAGFVTTALLGAYWYKFDYLTVLANSVFIHGIGYAALRQPGILVPTGGRSDKDGERHVDTEGTTKYRTSSLSEAERRVLQDRLVEVMRREKPYLRNDLKLADLAALAGLPSHQLSQVLNQQLGESFFEFVNRYRVEEARQLLADPRNDRFTVLALGFDAGFNNKTSFNQTFKRLTGTTPSGFRARPGREDASSISPLRRERSRQDS